MSFGGLATPGLARRLSAPPESLPWPEEDVEIKEEREGGWRKARKKGKGSCAPTKFFMNISPVRSFSSQFAKRIAPHTTGVNIGSVIDLPDATRGYTRTRSLPVRLSLGLLCKGIA